MATKRRAKKAKSAEAPMTRARLIELLNQDLAREYQAVIAYVVYSQVIKGAAYMSIAAELEVHASEEGSSSRRRPSAGTARGGQRAAPRPVPTGCGARHRSGCIAVPA